MRPPDCTSGEFEQMRASAPWAVYEEHLRDMLATKCRELEKDQPDAETQVCRGWVQALRRVIEQVPNSIMERLEADEN